MNEPTVVVFDVVDVQSSVARPTRARMEKAPSGAVKAVEASVSTIEASLGSFVQTVRGMLAKVEGQAGEYGIDTVEVSAQVSTEGKVGFMGIGLAAKGSSGMKIVFKRRPG